MMKIKGNPISRYIKFIFFIGLLCFSLECKKDESNPVGPEGELSEWKVLFSDNFNREDTVDNQIGDNWQINSPNTSSYVKLKDNSVYCVNQPLALYINKINEANIRVSAKITIQSSTSTVAGLLMRASLDYSKGYICWLTKSKLKICRYDDKNEVLLGSRDISIQANTTYIMILESDGENLNATLQSSSRETIATVSVSDSNYLTGKVGFKAGTQNPVLIDDFKIEKFTYRDNTDINSIFTIELKNS